MKLHYITTPHLKLRRMTPEVYQWAKESMTDSELYSFLGATSEENFLEMVGRIEKGFSTFNRDMCVFHLLDKQTEKILGWCGFHTWYLWHNRAEIGYEIFNPEQQGKGLMSEALPLVIQYGFEEMNLHRIEAFVAPNNPPSLAMMSKNGFVREGLLREHYLKDGRYEDSAVFSLLNEDYQKLSGLIQTRKDLSC